MVNSVAQTLMQGENNLKADLSAYAQNCLWAVIYPRFYKKSLLCFYSTMPHLEPSRRNVMGVSFCISPLFKVEL